MPPLSSLIPQKWPDIQIDAPLGSGACGTVYACTKKSAVTGIESREAVKVVRVEFSAAAHRQAEEEDIPFDEYYARIKAEKSREIELLVNLKSPHIVHINEFDAVEEPDHSAFYLLIRMDLLQALTAFRVDHLADTPEQAGAYARKVMLDICDALRVCHENGICHRDIKPANILYGATGDFYLGDFGVSQYTAAPDATLTSSGTARYAAPEQLTGQADPRSDLYSLGLVLYELTNHWRGPFLPAYPAKLTAEDRYNAQCKRLAGDALPPPDNCPPALAAVILKLCAPDPGDRYQSVQEVLDALSPSAAPATMQKKKPRRLWIGVGLVVAAVAVAWLTARVGGWKYYPNPGTVVETRDTTVWDYARKNGITVSDATHVGFNGGAYNYPCQTSGFYEYFEPDGVTDWGATRLSATVTGAKKSDPDADGSVTYTVAFDTTATLRYGFTKALLDDGTITELGMGRCFAGFGLLDAQTGTVFAPQQGAGNWPWSVPYLGYNSYTVVMRPQAEADKKYSDAPSPTREDPCQQVRPLTSYTLDDGRTCRLGFAEVGSWDFGETTGGQGNANGKTWAFFINKSTMHGVLQIKVDAGYDDLVLYYNAQGFGENDVFSYDVWAGDGEDGPLYLDELGYFKGMQGMRFYRLGELVSLFAEGA